MKIPLFALLLALTFSLLAFAQDGDDDSCFADDPDPVPSAPPAPAPSSSPPSPPSNGTSTTISPAAEAALIAALKTIAPATALEPCKDAAQAPGQCSSASQAAGPILRSFQKYTIESVAEKAAVVSLMVFETAEFKYQRNVFPGRPGQGTRNMQMPDFNKKYATSIEELTPILTPLSYNINATLDALVKNPDYDFGSAAWFLRNECDEGTQTALKKSDDGTMDAAWEMYLRKCVNIGIEEGAEIPEERKKYWIAAKEALKG
ncbi:hypothetical protein AJ80_05079 [Polytolypa hystricis UAMH7299]|uniref:Uncharacterized protein n=1 Tax=Polytolypa hystricis (strain UAMH7299) TaxID=1447883 RepID=A0A2B7XY96_POLH7|nr:hypothetical protein AJ80_05079 [Polytolypa hystricis UAMH7299]